MSKGEWTPGPWRYTVDTIAKNYVRITCTSCEHSGDNLSGYCGEDNARLIAAAPELVEALQSARSYVVAELEAELERMRGCEHLGRLGEIAADLAEIDAALEKAGAMPANFWDTVCRLVDEAELSARQDEPGIYEQAYAELLRFLIDHAPDSVRKRLDGARLNLLELAMQGGA